MKKTIIGALAAFALALSSCSESGRFLPTVQGSTYDLLVVGSDSVWNSQAGKVMDSLFGGPMPALPEDEPYFKVIPLRTQFFDATVKPTRNIVFYEVNPSRYTKGSVRYEKDLWARSQALVYITAPDVATLTATVRNNSARMLRYLVDAEEARAVDYYKSYTNRDFSEQIQKKFGVGMLVPTDLNKMRDTTGFMWISNGNMNVNQNLLVFSSPYTKESDFSAEHLVAVQDSFTTQFVPGPSENSFMKRQPLVPLTSEVLKNDNSDYCVEVRGRWHCPKDVMGGPFVSRNYLSADHKSIITAVAFLYAPGNPKRNRLRMLEACAGSLKVKAAKTDSTATK
ncbi:MAG: DUF4837 family protein [Paludibacteraceae bacterium]|nr:DUF4837 family protein [Paludibacteraceae bacterium]